MYIHHLPEKYEYIVVPKIEIHLFQMSLMVM